MARRARIEPIEWAAVYDDWQAHWLFSGEPEPGTDILDLPFASPTHGGAIRGPVIDWWPTAAIPERRRVLEQWGTAAFVMSPPWTTHQGTFHTAVR